MAAATETIHIVSAARSNEAFRRVVATGDHEQVVVMTIPPGGEIGEEVHPDTDQVLTFVDGHGEADMDGQTSEVRANDLVSSEPARAITFATPAIARYG